MTTLLNSFEGGSNGASITAGNSGGASGTAFTVINPGAGGTLAYSTAQAAHGTVSANTATGAGANPVSFGWDATTALGAAAQLWFRCYLYFTSAPAGLARFFTAPNNSGTGMARFQVNSTGTLTVQNSSGSPITTSTAVIPLNQWFRVEGMVILSATTGQTQVKLFTPKDATIPAETNTSAATQNTLSSGTPAGVLYGPAAGVASQGPYFMDDVGASTSGPLGPASAAARRGTSIVPSLIAAGAI